MDFFTLVLLLALTAFFVSTAALVALTVAWLYDKVRVARRRRAAARAEAP